MYARNGIGRKDKLEDSIVNSGKVAATRGLVLLGAESKRIYINTSIRGTGVVLVGLDDVKVRSLTFREAVLSVKLELSSDNGILTPAVHIKSSLSKYKCTSIRDRGTICTCGVSGSGVSSVRHLEYIIVNDRRCLVAATKGMDGIRKSIDGISIVERLGTKSLVKGLTALKRCTVINVGIRLNNPNKFLTRMVEVELDLVGRGTDRFITSELNLLNEILVGILCHLAALIGIKEDIIYIKGCSNKRLLVSSTDRNRSTARFKLLYSPEALTDRTEINVDLDLVVLVSNKREGKSRVTAKPELKRYVKCSLRKGVAGSTYLVGSSVRSARTRYVSKSRVSNVCKSGSVTNHLVVTRLLLLGKGKLIPDVHPVTVLTVDALTTNLNLNLSNKLLTDEV